MYDSNELNQWLLGRFTTGPRKGQRRTVFMPAPKQGMTHCWVWQGAVSHGRSSGLFAKGKPPGAGKTVHVQGEILRRKYQWPDLKGGIKVKMICGSALCCNADHMRAGELVTTVA